MVEDAGVGAPLCLHALTQYADIVDVQMGYAADTDVSKAAGGQPDLLARKPLQGAVGAHMEHRICPKHLVHPAIKGQIGMGRCAVGAVVELLRLFRGGAQRLQPHEKVAVADAWDNDLSAGYHDGTRGGPPALLHLRPGLGVEAVKPCLILRRRHRCRRPFQRGLRGEPPAVVGHRSPDAVDDLGPIREGVLRLQTPRLQSADHPEYRFRRVQAMGAADGVVSGRHVVEDNGQLLLRHGLPGQSRPSAGQLCHPLHPVRQRTAYLSPVCHPLCHRIGHGNELPVKLRLVDAHGQGDQIQPPDVPAVFIRAEISGKALNHRKAPVLKYAGGNLTRSRLASGQGGQAEAVGHHQRCRDGCAVFPSVSTLHPVEHAPFRPMVGRKRIRQGERDVPPGLDRAQQGVHVLQISGLGIMVMDQHTDHRPGLCGHLRSVTLFRLRRQKALQGIHTLPSGRVRGAERIVASKSPVDSAEHQLLQILRASGLVISVQRGVERRLQAQFGEQFGQFIPHGGGKIDRSPLQRFPKPRKTAEVLDRAVGSQKGHIRPRSVIQKRPLQCGISVDLPHRVNPSLH